MRRVAKNTSQMAYDRGMAPQLTTEVHSVAELIKATRTERDLSLRDVARLVGSTDVSVSNWERGKHQIKLGDAIRFADELNIPIEWMIEAMKREMAPIPKDESQSCALTGSNRGPADYGSWCDEHEAILPNFDTLADLEALWAVSAR